MAEKPETIADIIAELGEYRDPVIRERRLDIRLKAALARLEAAHKREKAAIEADALSVGGFVGAAHKRERGDCEKMFDALVRIGNWCAQDLAENAYTSDSSGNYLKTLNGLCEVCRPYMQKAIKLKRYGGVE